MKQLKSRRTTIPKKAILKDRNGQEWNVHLMEEADRLFIKTGWQDFVNSCSLEFGDFLIFRYFRKKLIFTVKVFSRNGCLKEDVASEAFNNRERPEPDIDKNRDVVELGSDDEEEEEEERVSQRRRSRPMRVCKRKFSDLNLDNLKKSSKLLRVQVNITIDFAENATYNASDIKQKTLFGRIDLLVLECICVYLFNLQQVQARSKGKLDCFNHW